MSWEVSTMPSKRSFFNRTLFLKNLGRFWPLWGGVSLAGAMLPLYLLLAMLQRQIHWVEPLEFAERLSAAAAYLVPAFTCGYAILCAMAVWGYLCNSRSAGMMHALPVDRTCLFVTGVLSGLAMILIPYAVTGGLMCLVALGWGFFWNRKAQRSFLRPKEASRPEPDRFSSPMGARLTAMGWVSVKTHSSFHTADRVWR